MEFNNATLASTAISALQDTSPRSSPGAPSSQSTPPTSLGDVNSEIDSFKEDREAREAEIIRRRSGRSRLSVPTYNDNVLSGTAVHIRRAFRKTYETEAESSNRSFSGATLVEDKLEIPKNSKILKELRIDANWTPADEKTAQYLKGHADGDDSEDDRPVVYSVWSMGKLVTETVKATKEKILERKESKRAQKEENANDRIRRLFPNLKIPETNSNKEESKVVEKTAEITKPTQVIRRTPAVRSSHTPKPAKQAPAKGPKAKFVASKAKGRKKYLSQGLYVGQHRNFDPKLSEAKNRKRLQELGIPEENRALPLPMFLGEEMLKQDEDYKLPFEILNPLRFEEHPKDWNKLNKNRFIGEASAAWKKSNLKKSVYSPCGCQGDRCDDTCLNRIFKYECNDDLCGIGPSCGNRPFAELAFRARCKNWHRKQEGEKYEANLWGEGVEVMRTGERGHGVRAMRSFEPHQIIVEYCGEIITQDESDRRMNNDYKGKNDYYLMTFKDSLIIDATRGSICRFVNHSCEPNCYVEMWKVNGEPRMGLFAGEDGIFTDEELTYDYNFEVYSEDNVQVCLCGSENCRGILGPTTLQQKKSRASKTMDTVKAAVKGVKRKAKEMIGLREDSESDSDDESSHPKRRRIVDPRSMLGKVGRQISNVSSGSEPAVQPMSGAELAAQKQSREERALKRSSSLRTLNSRVTEGRVTKSRRSKASFHVSDVSQAMKASNRRSMPAPRDPSPSTSEDESDSEPSTPVRVSPQAKASKPQVFDLPAGILKRGEDLFKAAMGSFVAGDVPSSTAPNRTKTIPPGSSSGMRQAKLSFGSMGGLVLKSSPAKPKSAAVAEEEEEEEEVVVKGPKIPKRGSSLGGSSKAARARKAISVAKHGVLGEAGVRKSIRRVSDGA